MGALHAPSFIVSRQSPDFSRDPPRPPRIIPFNLPDLKLQFEFVAELLPDALTDLVDEEEDI
jgi:hypothetical protein